MPEGSGVKTVSEENTVLMNKTQDKSVLYMNKKQAKNISTK